MDYLLGARYHKEERNYLTEKKETDRKKVEEKKSNSVALVINIILKNIIQITGISLTERVIFKG